ncbi:dTMP kinase [Phytomonospora sp. NPDC050363]|uniref:dTMP kinase n=1 Tax=Phytomonospora sp. NPDC050363 TaxID=3155642 RepID=UPI003408F6C1
MLGLSAMGDWLGLLATSLFAANQVEGATGKGLAFGSVIAVRLLPSLVLGPLAGIFADRWDRRLTMAICDMLRFALFASIPLVGLSLGGGIRAVGYAAIAQFAIEAVAMVWMPAKEAAVPNLLPKARLETANQLTLVTTYGLTPVLAAGVIGLLTSFDAELTSLGRWASAVDLALYFNALTFLAAALVVIFAIPELSQRKNGNGPPGAQPEKQGMLREFAEGWKYVGRTKLVRGLVLGILGAFASAGVVIGTAQFYARALGGGDATFSTLFATLFIGLGVGIVAGPKIVGQLSRRRWFGLSIIVAGCAVILDSIAPHVAVAMLGTFLVGAGAGMAFLSGITLLGGEVADDVRGRIFAFINTAARVVLMATIAGSGLIAGFGLARRVDWGILHVDLSATRFLLLAAGVIGISTGISALRQMDDKPGVPILKDVWSSIRGRPLSLGQPAEGKGYFIVFEGGDGSGKSSQVVKLAAHLRLSGHDVVLTREPGATDIGRRIRTLVLDPSTGSEPSPRAEALLYAADRAHHVATIVRPALREGKVVISDRYVDSSLAYQGGGRDLPTEEVAWLSDWATASLKPDLVVLLDIDPAIGLARASGRAGHDHIERESVAFHEKVRYKFLDIAAEDPRRYLVVDATLSEEEIFALVRAKVAERLPGGSSDDETVTPGTLATDGDFRQGPADPFLMEADLGDPRTPAREAGA